MSWHSITEFFTHNMQMTQPGTMWFDTNMIAGIEGNRHQITIHLMNGGMSVVTICNGSAYDVIEKINEHILGGPVVRRRI